MPKAPAKAGAPARAPVVPPLIESVSVAPLIPHWLIIARNYLGIHEGPGLANNPKVIDFFVKAGHAEIHEDSTPWCAAFVGAVLKDAGLQGTGSLWALSYATWGQNLVGPAIGAVATKKRVGGGHVFFVVGFDRSNVYGLGGNQNDQVSIAMFSRASINSWRWPPGMPLPKLVASAGQAGGAANVREA